MTLAPAHLLILDIDGLRQDVFHHALDEGRIPHLARLLGGAAADCGWHLDPLSPLPSITFAAQTTLFTGLHPGQHGIAGNEFFDRFGECVNFIVAERIRHTQFKIRGVRVDFL